MHLILHLSFCNLKHCVVAQLNRYQVECVCHFILIKLVLHRQPIRIKYFTVTVRILLQNWLMRQYDKFSLDESVK